MLSAFAKCSGTILGQPPLPPDKTPRTIPLGQPPPPPPDKPLGQNPPDKTTTDNPPPPPPHPTRQNPPPAQNPPTKHPERKPPRQNQKPKTWKIQDGVHFKFGWLQSSISNDMINVKLYVYIQLQMRYLIACGSI